MQEAIGQPYSESVIGLVYQKLTLASGIIARKETAKLD
jgi:hypothetical protein